MCAKIEIQKSGSNVSCQIQFRSSVSDFNSFGLLLEGKRAQPQRRRLRVWGLKTRPNSWPTLGFFWVTCYLKIMLPNFLTLDPPPSILSRIKKCILKFLHVDLYYSLFESHLSNCNYMFGEIYHKIKSMSYTPFRKIVHGASKKFTKLQLNNSSCRCGWSFWMKFGVLIDNIWAIYNKFFHKILKYLVEKMLELSCKNYFAVFACFVRQYLRL